ncbi:MAG: VOC family protein [Anaerolineae bacterium]
MITTTNFKIDQDLKVGLTTLKVKDLANMIDFYQTEIGLNLLEQDSQSAVLGIASDNRPILRMISKPDGRAHPHATGLFHLAILLPERADLGQWLRHYSQNHQLDGAGDHIVSEALYLNDPEGNGLEIYWDRPRDTWTVSGESIQMDTLRVDIPSLLADAHATPFSQMPSGTTTGHIHLQVDSVEKAIAFYRDILGFSQTAYMSTQAGFFGAGGYHHHIGSNIWNSRGAAPPPADALGLDCYELVFSAQDKLEQVLARLKENNISFNEINAGFEAKDPAGNQMVLKAISTN